MIRRVCRGSLAKNDGKEIAVESLEKLVEDGEGEFRNEVKISERTHNNNLVRLIGFCSEGSNRLLVHEFKIIHCNIKPHNVLMDKSWSAKISDFGLSRL